MNRERQSAAAIGGPDAMHERAALTGRQLLDLKSIISGIEADLGQVRQGNRALFGKTRIGQRPRFVCS